eukprot:2726421-Amphidinium_carterae.1
MTKPAVRAAPFTPTPFTPGKASGSGVNPSSGSGVNPAPAGDNRRDWSADAPGGDPIRELEELGGNRVQGARLNFPGPPSFTPRPLPSNSPGAESGMLFKTPLVSLVVNVDLLAAHIPTMMFPSSDEIPNSWTLYCHNAKVLNEHFPKIRVLSECLLLAYLR